MYLKIGQAAKLWQVSPTKVKRWIISGRLDAVNVGEPGKRPQYRLSPDSLKSLRPVKTRTSRKITETLYEVDI